MTVCNSENIKELWQQWVQECAAEQGCTVEEFERRLRDGEAYIAVKFVGSTNGTVPSPE